MNFEKVEESSINAAELRDHLLSGELEPGDFLEALREIDQSTSTHEAAFKNIEILTEPGVAALCLKENKGDFGYYNLLALSYFHVGQIQAMKGLGALVYFIKALEASEHLSSDDDPWKSYIRATVAYFQKDTQTLERMYNALLGGNNKKIIWNMLEGLKSRGEIDYRTDYRV